MKAENLGPAEHHIEEPMDCLSAHDDTERVVMMFASQTGKQKA